MSDGVFEDIDLLRAAAKKTLYAANSIERSRALPRGGEFFEVGHSYTLFFERQYYEEVLTDEVTNMRVTAVDGHVVRFANGTVLNTLSRTFARAVRRG